MKRRSAWLSFAACALISAHPAKATVTEKTVSLTSKLQLHGVTDFSNVQTVAIGDAVGFFDGSTGKMYLYNSSLSKCISIKKMKCLGAPAETIHS